MGLDHGHGWVLGSALLHCTFTVSGLFRVVCLVLPEAERYFYRAQAGPSRPCLLNRALHADQSSGLCENQGKSWAVICLV